MIYCYDGGFDGLLCCVFESYASRELPFDILPEGAELPLLLPVKRVASVPEYAARVRRAIPEKLGGEALPFLQRAFLTCLPQKELLILRFLRLGFREGPAVMRMLTDDTMYALTEAVRRLEREAHLYTGFVRFSEADGALAAQIEPKNIVLPVIAPHFLTRFHTERFVIHDRTHGMALLHEGGAWEIAAVSDFAMPAPGENERRFRALWRLFYDTAEVEGRHNPRVRMTHMPKRYWECMTEFARAEAEPSAGRPPQFSNVPAPARPNVQDKDHI